MGRRDYNAESRQMNRVLPAKFQSILYSDNILSTFGVRYASEMISKVRR